jgi:hypothetical protein
MPSKHAMNQEIEDLEHKVEGAREAAARPDAGERDKSDLKLIEQDYMAAQQKAKHADSAKKPAKADPADATRTVDQKLDAALKESFPGSDPVSFVQAAPVKKQDHELPAVKSAAQQHPEKTKAARKAG